MDLGQSTSKYGLRGPRPSTWPKVGTGRRHPGAGAPGARARPPCRRLGPAKAGSAFPFELKAVLLVFPYLKTPNRLRTPIKEEERPPLINNTF